MGEALWQEGICGHRVYLPDFSPPATACLRWAVSDSGMAGVCCCQKLGRVVKDWPTDWDMCLVWARLHVHLQWEKEVCGLVAQLLQCLYPPVQWLPPLAKSLGVGDGVPGGEGPPSVAVPRCFGLALPASSPWEPISAPVAQSSHTQEGRLVSAVKGAFEDCA